MSSFFFVIEIPVARRAVSTAIPLCEALEFTYFPSEARRSVSENDQFGSHTCVRWGSGQNSFLYSVCLSVCSSVSAKLLLDRWADFDEIFRDDS